MPTRMFTALLILIFVNSPTSLTAQQVEPSSNRNEESKAPTTTTAEWVAELDSDIYEARRHATEELIMAGQPSIEPVANAVQQGSLETISRGVFILRQIALTSDDTQTSAQSYDALRKISEQPFSTASRHAAAALNAVHEKRHQQAQQRLTELGAMISITQVPVAANMQQGFPSITFNSNWKGTLEDLRQLNWITRYRPNDNTPFWMIVLEGEKVTDGWMDYIRSLENVSVLKFKSASITDEALRSLVDMRDLRILEVLYTPVTDAAIEPLLGLPKVQRLRLYGNNFSESGWKRLQQQMANLEIDLRRGGFLGIGCDDNPCRVTIVRPGSVAATAGIQAGDVILSYNQQPVQTMEELTQCIGQNSAGDKVSIEILRDNQQLKKEVVLGKWE